jgi:hypothetical protein
MAGNGCCEIATPLAKTRLLLGALVWTMVSGAERAVDTSSLIGGGGRSPEMRFMKTRAFSSLVVRFVGLVGLVVILLPSGFGSSGHAQAAFAIKSLACDNWMYDPGNEDQVWLITVTLTEPAVSDVQVQFTTDRPEIVTWTSIYSAPSDGRAQVPQGQTDGALFLNSEFQPVATTITVSASDGTNTFTCKALIPKKVNTPTPVVTPNLTPTATRTPLPPPELSTMRMQVGSRSGNYSSIRICLDRRVQARRVDIALVSDHPGFFPVPPIMDIVEGGRCASFLVNVKETRAPVLVTVTATLGNSSLSGTTLVRPARPAIYMQTGSRALGLSKVTVCDLVAGGTVALASDRPDIFPVPDTLILPDGHACQSIVVPVGAVDSATPVTITATFTSGTRTGTTVVRDMGVAAAEATASVPTETIAPMMTVPPAATETPRPVGTPVL